MAAGGVGEMEEEESAEDLTPVVKVLVATDVMRKSEKKGPNFLGRHGPISILTFSESFCFLDFIRFSEFWGIFYI